MAISAGLCTRAASPATADGPWARASLRKIGARSSHFLRHVFELWLAIADGQHGFLIVHMHTRLEIHLVQHCCVDVHESHGRMVGKQMTTARLAPLAKTDGGLVVRADIGRAMRHLQ